MILNPNKTSALVVSRSETVNPPNCDLVLSGVSIRTSPKLDILGVKFDSKLTSEDHVPVIFSRASLCENWYFEVGEACLCGHLCVASFLLSVCFPNP